MTDTRHHVRYGEIRNSDDLKILVSSLEKVRAKTNEEWQVADILNAIYNNGAQFILGVDNEEDICVFFTQTNAYTGDKEIWVWASYAKDISIYISELKEIGEEIGAKRIKFSSTRPGWIKTIEKLGGKVLRTEFVWNLI